MDDRDLKGLSFRASLTARPLLVGTAGWSIPKALSSAFASSGSTLERYASRFNAVEIDSSFYRPHQRKTYERWAASVPEGFRFAVKAPRQITHERRLLHAQALLDPFLDQIGGLGSKLGSVLFQLPPSLTFEDEMAGAFFATWRARFDGTTVCEPRHISWFSKAANHRLSAADISRAAVDPALCADAAEPGGYSGAPYFRFHGSPLLYRSAYGVNRLRALLQPLADTPGDAAAWCILDNTMAGAATEDALMLTG